MTRKYKILIFITAFVFIADQITKIAVSHYLELGERIPIIPDFLDLVHFRNTGAAFGLFSNVGDEVRIPFFYIIAVVAVVLLGLFYRSLNENDRLTQVAVSLVFAGIAGNIIDRIRLGAVVDFLSFRMGDIVLSFGLFGRKFSFELEWPAFNVADSAITIAMFILILSSFKKKVN